MSMNAVERLHDDFSSLRGFLEGNNGAHLLHVVDESFPKTLLLAAASNFESCLTKSVKDFDKEVTTDDHPLVSLIEARAVQRQYHGWFDWDAKNVNKFFSLFGAAFKQYAIDAVGRDIGLKGSIRAFLEIGNIRNALVHQDFASFSLNKTSEEVYELYQSATVFVDWFPQAIREFSSTDGQPAA